MPETLHRLVYHSRNLLPGPEEAVSAAIRQILAVSRRNNTAAGVTGALMFNQGCFAQVLEGPRATVERTFERIQRDPRHSDVVLLQFGTVERRAFPGWSMAFAGRSAAGAAAYGAIAAETGFDPATLSGDRLLAILQEVVLEEEDVQPAA